MKQIDEVTKSGEQAADVTPATQTENVTKVDDSVTNPNVVAQASEAAGQGPVEPREKPKKGEAAFKPIIPYDPPLDDDRVSKVMENIKTRKEDPTVQKALREAYKTQYGFEVVGFKEPWTGINETDIEAVLLVSDSLDRPPEEVLSLWIHEGKIEWNEQLHGINQHSMGAAFGKSKVDDVATAAGWSYDKIRPWVRARVLDWQFGLDYLTRRHMSQQQIMNIPLDNLPNLAANHFLMGVKELIEHAETSGWEPLLGRTAQDISDYFVKVGGALGVKKLSNNTVVYAIRKNSVPSWLFLQFALFLKYDFGLSLELVQPLLDPWVVYWAFNAGVKRNGGRKGIVELYFEDKDPEMVIKSVFDPSADEFSQLSDDEIETYKKASRREPVMEAYKASKGNAIAHKYLIESVKPFFEGT